jgi:flagellum-specific ATP synthase
VRGILDGHVVLDRAIAERGRYPAVNILRSVSRTMPDCNTAEQNALVDRARQLFAVYEDMAELIRLGAYRHGSDAQVDEAIHYYQGLENFLRQTKPEKTDLESCYRALAEILDMPQAMAPDTVPAPAGEAAPAPPAVEAPPQVLPQAPPRPRRRWRRNPSSSTVRSRSCNRPPSRARACCRSRRRRRRRRPSRPATPTPSRELGLLLR